MRITGISAARRLNWFPVYPSRGNYSPERFGTLCEPRKLILGPVSRKEFK
jgi:hypothetical protein